MSIMKLFNKVVLLILIALSVCSLLLLLYSTNKVSIKKVSLEQGFTDISNKEYTISSGQLSSGGNNIILRFYHPKKIDYDFINRLAENKIKYSLVVELRDTSNKVLNIEEINQNSKFPSGGSRECFEWYLLSFNVDSGQNYKINVTFLSDDPFLSNATKDIYVQQNYDYAALPYFYVLQYIVLRVFIVLVLITVIWGFIIYRLSKKGRNK